MNRKHEQADAQAAHEPGEKYTLSIGYTCSFAGIGQGWYSQDNRDHLLPTIYNLLK